MILFFSHLNLQKGSRKRDRQTLSYPGNGATFSGNGVPPEGNCRGGGESIESSKYKVLKYQPTTRNNSELPNVSNQYMVIYIFFSANVESFKMFLKMQNYIYLRIYSYLKEQFKMQLLCKGDIFFTYHQTTLQSCYFACDDIPL